MHDLTGIIPTQYAIETYASLEELRLSSHGELVLDVIMPDNAPSIEVRFRSTKGIGDALVLVASASQQLPDRLDVVTVQESFDAGTSTVSIDSSPANMPEDIKLSLIACIISTAWKVRYKI